MWNRRPHSYTRLLCHALIIAMPPVSNDHQTTTAYMCWMPQLVWSAVPTSSTEACRDSSIPSYICPLFLSESRTKSASWYSTSYMATVQCLSPCGIVPTSCRYRITCLKIHVPQRRQSASYVYYSNNFKVSKIKGVTYNMVFQVLMVIYSDYMLYSFCLHCVSFR